MSNQNRRMPMHVRIPPGAADDGEFIDGGSIREDRSRTREGSAMAAHYTRESFVKAACFERPPLPPDPDPAGTRRAMLRAFQEKYGNPALPNLSNERANRAARDFMRDQTRGRMARERVYNPGAVPECGAAIIADDSELDDPALATDAEIRRATRTGREQ